MRKMEVKLEFYIMDVATLTIKIESENVPYELIMELVELLRKRVKQDTKFEEK